MLLYIVILVSSFEWWSKASTFLSRFSPLIFIEAKNTWYAHIQDIISCIVDEPHAIQDSKEQ